MCCLCCQCAGLNYRPHDRCVKYSCFLFWSATLGMSQERAYSIYYLKLGQFLILTPESRMNDWELISPWPNGSVIVTKSIVLVNGTRYLMFWYLFPSSSSHPRYVYNTTLKTYPLLFRCFATDTNA